MHCAPCLKIMLNVFSFHVYIYVSVNLLAYHSWCSSILYTHMHTFSAVYLFSVHIIFSNQFDNNMIITWTSHVTNMAVSCKNSLFYNKLMSSFEKVQINDCTHFLDFSSSYFFKKSLGIALVSAIFFLAAWVDT